LRVAFAAEQSRKVVKGIISVNGDTWTSVELRRYLGEYVSVFMPKYESWDVLPVKGEDGQWLGFVERQERFHPMDPRGARHAAAGSRDLEKAIKAMAQEVPRVDIAALFCESAASADPAPLAPSAGTISISDEHAAIGRALTETPAQRRDRDEEANERQMAEQRKRIEGFRSPASQNAQRKAG